MTNVKISPEGKVALVTGSNRGIGKAIAEELLKRGAKKVYAGARRLESLDSLKAIYGDRLEAVQLDVTDQNSIAQAAEQIGEIDILVNNAGVLNMGGFFDDNSVDSLRKNLDVNVFGLVNVSRAFIDRIKSKSESAIVNVASVAGLASMPMLGTYSLSKAAVHSITQGMRGELAANDVLVTGVYPGPIDTDMTKGFEMDMDTPQNVAMHVVNALEQGKEDVFPDAMSEQIGKAYFADPKAVEKQFAVYLAEPA